MYRREKEKKKNCKEREREKEKYLKTQKCICRYVEVIALKRFF